MKIALHADPQLDDRATPGLAEQMGTLHFIACEMAARHVDLSLSGGDTWERVHGSEEERQAVDQYVVEQADVCPFGVVYGNHDPILDFAALERLATRHRVVAAIAPRVELMGGAAVAFLPYPRMATLRGWFETRNPGRVLSVEESGALARALLADVIRGLGAQLDEVAPIGSGIPRILLGHGMTDGGKSSTGQPIIGDELRIGLDELGLARCHLYCFGHLHNGVANEFEVRWPDGTGHVGLHAGSTRRRDFGEVEPKRFVVFTFEGDKLRAREDVPLPVPPMYLVEAAWGAGGFGDLAGLPDDPSDLDGALMRFRYTVDADRQEAARTAAATAADDWKTRGAAMVKVDPIVNPQVRARAPEVATAPTLQGRIDATWAAMGDSAPAVERRPRLLELAASVAEGAAS